MSTPNFPGQQWPPFQPGQQQWAPPAATLTPAPAPTPQAPTVAPTTTAPLPTAEQFAQPQAAQPHAQPQFGQQFAAPTQQWGAPQQMWGGPPPQQKGFFSTGGGKAVIALLAVVVLAGLGVGGYFLFSGGGSGDTSSEAAPPKNYDLENGVSLDVSVPAGWELSTGTYGGEPILVLQPEADAVSADKAVDAYTNTLQGEDPENAVHAVYLFSDKCIDPESTTQKGDWEVRTTEADTAGDYEYAMNLATREAHGCDEYELQLRSIDTGRSDAGEEAEKLFNTIVDGEVISNVKVDD